MHARDVWELESKAVGRVVVGNSLTGGDGGLESALLVQAQPVARSRAGVNETSKLLASDPAKCNNPDLNDDALLKHCDSRAGIR